jgi:hypothetical protein
MDYKGVHAAGTEPVGVFPETPLLIIDIDIDRKLLFRGSHVLGAAQVSSSSG